VEQKLARRALFKEAPDAKMNPRQGQPSQQEGKKETNRQNWGKRLKKSGGDLFTMEEGYKVNEEGRGRG